MSIRAERVAGEIKKVLSQPISDLARANSAGMATITAVRLSSDLTIAKVYVSLYGKDFPPLQFISILDRAKGSLRSQVGSAIRLRSTPDLKFFIDDTMDEMDHIQKLLDSVKSGDSFNAN